MANTRELRRRIKSIKNTSQITKAMEMVAATKMRRAQTQALSGRPYSLNLAQALQRLLPQIEIEAHPLLSGNESKTAGVILLSSDKGLCGSLNTNLFRTVLASHLQGVNVNFYTVGKKGRSFVVKSGQDLTADFENLDTVIFRQAVQLSKIVTQAFLAGELGEVYLIYPHFISTLRQEPRRVKLLPIALESVILIPSEAEGEGSRSLSAKESETSSDDKGGGKEFLFEPNPDALLDFILVHHIEEQIYQALLETKASEHSSRMMAMKNATDNALDLVEDLRLTYNQTRQDAITREILEITTASVAME